MAEVAHVIWMKNAADTPTDKESPIYTFEKQEPSLISSLSGESKFSRLAPSSWWIVSSHIPLFYANNGDDIYLIAFQA